MHNRHGDGPERCPIARAHVGERPEARCRRGARPPRFTSQGARAPRFTSQGRPAAKIHVGGASRRQDLFGVGDVGASRPPGGPPFSKVYPALMTLERSGPRAGRGFQHLRAEVDVGRERVRASSTSATRCRQGPLTTKIRDHQDPRHKVDLGAARTRKARPGGPSGPLYLARWITQRIARWRGQERVVRRRRSSIRWCVWVCKAKDARPFPTAGG